MYPRGAYIHNKIKAYYVKWYLVLCIKTNNKQILGGRGTSELKPEEEKASDSADDQARTEEDLI